MIRRLIAVFGVLMLLATLGCGTKGPLYLPPETAEPQQTGQPKMEQEEEKES
jgi:predicted small lipoprotein YifL